jgi:hypothetical protein
MMTRDYIVRVRQEKIKAARNALIGVPKNHYTRPRKEAALSSAIWLLDQVDADLMAFEQEWKPVFDLCKKPHNALLCGERSESETAIS